MQTQNLNIAKINALGSPAEMLAEIPQSDTSTKLVVESRKIIQDILTGKDKRFMVIVGPCSIHDDKAALEYADKLAELARRFEDKLYIVMRVYFEKPRTTVGWKGLINDPYLDGTCDITEGLIKARQILLKITEMGIPTATELLETITPQYVADLVCWAAIGARTTESQTHREMASGLSMTVGYKNGTDGNLGTAINAMLAARAPQSFLGIDPEGLTSIVKTNGNPSGHIVLRGGKRPNYDARSIEEARLELIGNNLPDTIMVDCSHANSKKKFQGQALVWKNIIDQRVSGNDASMNAQARVPMP